MCSLSTFPSPPSQGYVTLCERNVEMLVCLKSELPDDGLILNFQYPEVNISAESHIPSSLRDSEARAAFLEHDDTPTKRIVKAWYEHGLSGVLEEMSSSRSHGDEKSFLGHFAGSVLAMVRWLDSLHGSLFPHLTMSNEELITEFSSNSNWRAGLIRCFAWHPHTTKFALALRDDSVKVYTARKGDIVPTLKHKMQRGVSALAWKPCSASALAVACQGCILLWQVEPMSLATRPSSSAVRVLSEPKHCPVTSLAWEPSGAYLASACPTDTAIRIWDVAMETCVPLRRVGGGGISLLNWSPDGSKLLSASPSSIFRVWETQLWTCEKWSKLSSRCKAACWSPDGHNLLFATADESIIYSLTFKPSQPASDKTVLEGSKVAVPVADLTEVTIETEEECIKVGGLVQDMCWDPSGERLAVHFNGPDQELIAIFQTRLEPMLELIPCGYVRGYPSEIPNIISFQPTFKEGALLTVVWSSGRVGYVPMYFLSRDKVETSALYQQQHTSAQIASASLYTD